MSRRGETAVAAALLRIAEALNRIADGMPANQDSVVRNLTADLAGGTTRLDAAIHNVPAQENKTP